MTDDCITMSANDIYLADPKTITSSITISSDCIRLNSTGIYFDAPVGVTHKTNCINCGAPLSGKSLCRYCDTYNR